MKYRSFYLSAAFIGMLAGVHCIPAFSVPASAVEVTLTEEQTHALFGTNIACQYYDDNLNYMVDAVFTYYGNGSITGKNAAASNWNFAGNYDATGSDCIIYKLSLEHPISTVANHGLNLYVRPVIDLSNLNYIKFGVGNPTNLEYFPEFTLSGYNYSSNRLMLLQNGDTDPTFSQNFVAYWWNWRQNYGVPVNYHIDFDDEDDPEYYQTFLYQVFISEADNFTISSYSSDPNYDVQLGLFLREWIQPLPALTGTDYYICVTCPTLSSEYVNNAESSGGGDESSGGGYDGPDYTDQLALILAKLDLIINNDFNFDVNLDADLSGVESRLDGINSRLDGTNSRLDGNNSRLDGNNSRLDGVNSRLDGVNSRLDGISGELHSLNSAPSGTLPRTGAENSEFDRQAEMYLSDFQNEYSDPENQPFEVAEGSSGFLSFVREFLLRSHLAGVLPVLALLFIVHYTIFDRRG